ncbi:MAG: 3-hydroxyacyl-CoA dehydrogenase [Verrucomicrobia bacterium]|nr:3-hydroxyacyl-CoA dehydrogenase [Verrucomicrobiota bacterium]
MSAVHYECHDGLGVLRLDAPPVNVLSLALLEDLEGALRRAQADAQVQGLVITGGTRQFSTGADVGLFRAVTTAEDAVRISCRFQAVFQAVEDSTKPVVAALAGHVIGGALELALACHYRVCRPDTRFSAPEVKLGINSGAGGTQRLPRLIGLGPALELLLTGQVISAPAALAAGLVDSVCSGEDPIASAAALLEARPPVRKTRERAERLKDAQANAGALAEAQARVANVRPGLIAPAQILAAVETGLRESYAAGLRREQTGFAACLQTQATQNLIHLFFATRDLGKAPALEGVPAGPVAKVGVVGVGSMGIGIAQALLAAGLPVVALDQNETLVRQGSDRIRRALTHRVAQGKCAPERAEQMLALLRPTTRWEELADVDLAIEAVFEEVAVKRAVFAALEPHCRPEAILASNTSTLSLDELAAGLERPERLIGLHFFNPAQRMPLVEVIYRHGTPPAVTATALRFAKAIRKTPLLVLNHPGFVVNRMFVPYVKEAFWLLEEGAEPRAIDQAMVEFGFPMGPLVLTDLAGLDILARTDQVLSRAFPRHGPLPSVVARLVAEGRLGQKTGAGVYRYEPGERRPHDCEATRELVCAVRREQGSAARAIGPDEITERLVLRMANEAFGLLEDGVARRAADVDAATVLGLGFPDFRGGILRYAHEAGLGNVRTRLGELARRWGERFAPGELRSH